MDEKQLGELIREARKEQGLTQLEVANQIGVFKSIISRAENGRVKLNLQTMNKIAEALNCDLIIKFQKR